MPSPRKSRREATNYAAYRDALDRGSPERLLGDGATPLRDVVCAAADDFTCGTLHETSAREFCSNRHRLVKPRWFLGGSYGVRVASERHAAH